MEARNETPREKDPRFVAAEDLTVVNTDQGGVIYRPSDAMYFGLNPTASFIWSLISAPRSRKEICEGVCRKFAVDCDRAERDVDGFLRSMLANNLVREVEVANDAAS